MALYKEMTTPRGAVVRYHKISAIKKLSNVIFVQVSAYADQSYRLKEHDTDMDTERFLELQREIVRLKGSVEQTPEEEKRLTELMGEYRDMGSAMFAQNTLQNAVETYGEFVCLDSEEDDDISFSNIYGKLKKSVTYFGAEDC